MTPSKLSDSEKLDVVRLYQQPKETTSTLAERYGVSSTTIRRALKSRLSSEEYEALTSQKQIMRWHEVDVPELPGNQASPSNAVPHPSTTQDVTQSELNLGQPPSPTSTRRSRKRSSTPTPAIPISATNQDSINDSDDAIATNAAAGLEDKVLRVESKTSNNFDSVQTYADDGSIEDAKEFLAELDEELDAGLDELSDEDFEDDLESLPPPTGEKPSYAGEQVRLEVLMNVLPLSEALIPRTCYLVVDRSAELVARPLREFCDLGQVPSKETQEKTLPVFDNHRVARRFSNRSQRVIKIPDGGMLQKACSQLHAKGITRLLINGRVYSL